MRMSCNFDHILEEPQGRTAGFLIEYSEQMDYSLRRLPMRSKDMRRDSSHAMSLQELFFIPVISNIFQQRA